MPLSEPIQVYQNNSNDYQDMEVEIEKPKKKTKSQEKYKKYTFKDFLEMKKKAEAYKAGGLGANLSGESWERGHKRLKLISSYE